MSNLPALPSFGGGLSREQRGLERQRGQIAARTEISIASVNGQAQTWGELLHEVTMLHGQAIQDTILVAQAEMAAAQIVPHAVHRISHLAENHALVAGQIMGRAATGMARLVQ